MSWRGVGEGDYRSGVEKGERGYRNSCWSVGREGGYRMGCWSGRRRNAIGQFLGVGEGEGGDRRS